MTPLIPTTLSLRTLEQLKEFLIEHNLQNVALVPFFSMVDRRKNMHKEMMASLVNTHPEILQTPIPYASDIERMCLERMPLGDFTTKSKLLDAYQALWKELLMRTND